MTDWPEIHTNSSSDLSLVEEMNIARFIAEAAHAERKKLVIKVRQPLKSLTVTCEKNVSTEITQVIKDEVNVKEIVWKEGVGLSVSFDTSLTPELIAEGEARDLVRKIQEERKLLGTTMDEKVNVSLESLPVGFEEYIKKNALVNQIEIGQVFTVSKIS